jgi:hypothetical protein
VIRKEAEEKLKYKHLSIEIQGMWRMKCFVIPVIIRGTGIVSKGLYTEMSGNNTRKAFIRLCTQNSCTRHIAHSKESATI